MSNDNNSNQNNRPKLFARIDTAAQNSGQTAQAKTADAGQQKAKQSKTRFKSGRGQQSTGARSAKQQSGSTSTKKQQGGRTQSKTAQSQGTNRTKASSASGSSGKRAGKGGDAAKMAAVRSLPAAAELIPRKMTNHMDVRNGQTLRITPLGGIGEIGKNLTVYQCGGDSLIVDCGLSFPDDELFGVDIVIPDFTYLEEIRDTLRGVVITHGHEDHIGALPYFLKEFDLPIYGTRLTIGLIKSKLTEHNLQNSVKAQIFEPGQVIKFGCMSVEPIRVNHSIPDAVALAITTPAGVVIQTGDFKIDYTPVFDETIDLTRLAALGDAGVLALLSDSTNAEKPGSSMTESNVGQALEKLFSRAEGKRLIIASFASNIQRVQQIITLAQKHGRKIAFSGRSMENYTNIALELGYIKVADGVIIGIDEVNRYRAGDIIIITTGSQGEPLSALSRMASGNHRQIAITSNDMIIISATPIPGNEKAVGNVINDLIKLGSDVYYESMYEVHASGHACQDELKLMMKLTKPKYFVPVHGEYKQLVKHAGVARAVGIENANIIIPDLGRVIEFKNSIGRKGEQVPSGRVLVDGLGVGDVGSTVLRDRKLLSQDGLMVVIVCIDPDTREIISGPDIISRGFVYVKEAEPLMAEARELTKSILDRWSGAERNVGRNDLKMRIREDLNKLLYQRTKRSPMILPVIMEV